MPFEHSQNMGKQEFEAMTALIFQNMWKLSGLSELEFNTRYRTGAIERLRGQHAASTAKKGKFIEDVLSHMRSEGFIAAWSYIGGTGRADYKVDLLSGRIAVIEAKGSLDGNSANIFERPSYADELVIWSMTSNPMSDVVKNIWSGIHCRISPEYIAAGKRIDMLIAWDALGSSARLLPGLESVSSVVIDGMALVPPCVFLIPNQLPVIDKRNPVVAQELERLEFGDAIVRCFGIPSDMIGKVSFEISPHKDGLARKTTVNFGEELWKCSKFVPIRRDLSAYKKSVAAAE